MHVAFRVDASLQIGSGHVMRCLTLAAALREHGAECHFICREHPGNLIDYIRAQGFAVTTVPATEADFQPANASDAPSHASWLGVSWETDAEATCQILQSLAAQWLIVDHYALDRRWERTVRSHCDRLMVIDDLADREHDCDLLLDQNLGRVAADYASLVPTSCTLLLGPRYALLRPEFVALREYSLARRNPPQLRRILVTMGGVDRGNATGLVLEALQHCELAEDCHITVVMGMHAPWLTQVQEQVTNCRWPCDLRVNASDMAQLMADSDLAIGAAGGTSWERCALGLPALIGVTAENQEGVARALVAAGAAICMGDLHDTDCTLPREISAMDAVRLADLSNAASCLGDGLGTHRVLGALGLVPCSVRIMQVGDLEMVLEWRNHPDVRRFMYTQHEISLGEHTAWFERCDKDSGRHLLIVEQQERPFGFVQFTEHGNGAAMWGFYLAPGATNGNGRELGIAALNHAFNILGLRKVCGEALKSNNRSVNFHRRLGFREENLDQDGRSEFHDRKDICYFTLLADEWIELQSDMNP